MHGVARKCPQLLWALAWTLTVPPAPARAAPPTGPATATSGSGSTPTVTGPDPFSAAAQAADAATRARLEAIYNTANEATLAGDFAAAADRYAEVLGLLPETRENHESRALALLDSVAARRQAALAGDTGQLCRARDMTRRYLTAAFTAHSLHAAELDGVRQAQQLRDELELEIADLSVKTCPGDQVPVPRPPLRLAPAPTPGPDPRKIAGGVLLGIGGLGLGLLATGLGVGAGAESRLDQARDADPGREIDAILADGLIQRGRAANNLAIAGSVLAGVALVTGATLLVLARPAARARVAVVPGGLGLRF